MAACMFLILSLSNSRLELSDNIILCYNEEKIEVFKCSRQVISFQQTGKTLTSRWENVCYRLVNCGLGKKENTRSAIGELQHLSWYMFA